MKICAHVFKREMSVLIETTIGDIVIDLLVEQRPICEIKKHNK